MSSSYDVGYYADQAYKAEQQPCDKSPTGKHESEVAEGSLPSVRFRCKWCKKHLGYSK